MQLVHTTPAAVFVVSLILARIAVVVSSSAPCDSSPCLHGGTCENKESLLSLLTGAYYMCTCTPGYYGRRCEVSVISSSTTKLTPTAVTTTQSAPTSKQTVGPCDSNPCLNGGTCRNRMADSDQAAFECVCQAGYTGSSCTRAEAVDQTPPRIAPYATVVTFPDVNFIATFNGSSTSVAAVQFASTLWMELMEKGVAGSDLHSILLRDGGDPKQATASKRVVAIVGCNTQVACDKVSHLSSNIVCGFVFVERRRYCSNGQHDNMALTGSRHFSLAGKLGVSLAAALCVLVAVVSTVVVVSRRRTRQRQQNLVDAMELDTASSGLASSGSFAGNALGSVVHCHTQPSFPIQPLPGSTMAAQSRVVADAPALHGRSLSSFVRHVTMQQPNLETDDGYSLADGSVFRRNLDAEHVACSNA
eukprot:m.100926 g.100926  ORF g.100926 m.100926 type:complete len:417 (+) comp13186_c0_seq1:1426-2676(+)